MRPGPGIRLDADMGRAIEKLGRLQAITHSLPGRDCGACGAPTCAALAEDVVMERAGVELCPYAALREGGPDMRLHELAEALDLRELTPAAGADGADGDDHSRLRVGPAQRRPGPRPGGRGAGNPAGAPERHRGRQPRGPAGGHLLVRADAGRRILERAAEEGLSLFGTQADTFEIVGRLYELGLRGSPA